MKFSVVTIVMMLLASFAAAQTPEKISLKAGQQKATKASRISVKFVAVTEDSRCPEGTNCIWAGMATVKLQLRKNGKTAEFDLNTNQPDKSAIFEGHEIKFTSLNPYPKSTGPIVKSSYSAIFSVTKVRK